jgi:protein-S-isoprenylcysteine O-methyltransferase Ste14
MNDFRDEQISERDRDFFARSAMSGMNSSAHSSMVNRTHRVVRERAQTIAARRDKTRSLWIPMAVCSALVLIICTAVWSVLDQYEISPTGVPDSSDQFLVLALWFFPVSMALLAMVWFRRTRKRSGREAM